MSLFAGFGIAVALSSAALMGLAIQRGATCMVAAVDEVVTSGRMQRAIALSEAAFWVSGGLALASLGGILAMAPSARPVAIGTLAGGALLGIGAFVNRACVFGAIARLGSGQWAYAATPLGFFLGCLSVTLFAPAMAPPIAMPSPVLAHAAWIAVGFGALLCWRAVQALTSPRLLDHVWHPHRATLLIGVTFVSTMLTVGAWAYTDALADLARARLDGLGLRLAMLLALIAGAISGGAIAGVLRAQRPGLGDVARCLIGGMLMGWGGALVPGSNDGLILVGLPLLQPHAWMAVTVMTAAIAAPMLIARRCRRTEAR